MIIQRWGSQYEPDKAALKKQLTREGLDVSEEMIAEGQAVRDHRHAFTEVRIVLKGELLYSVKGNQFVLQPGDRVEIPSNTKHSHQVKTGSTAVESLVGYKL